MTRWEPCFPTKNGFPCAILNFQEKQNILIVALLSWDFEDIWTLLLLLWQVIIIDTHAKIWFVVH